jgi:hypothetical protein
MIGVRLLYALSLVNLALLAADLAYNVLGALIGMPTSGK